MGCSINTVAGELHLTLEYSVIHRPQRVNHPHPPTLGSYFCEDCEAKHYWSLEFKSNIGAATVSDTAATVYLVDLTNIHFIQWFPNQTRCPE